MSHVPHHCNEHEMIVKSMHSGFKSLLYVYILSVESQKILEVFHCTWVWDLPRYGVKKFPLFYSKISCRFFSVSKYKSTCISYIFSSLLSHNKNYRIWTFIAYTTKQPPKPLKKNTQIWPLCETYLCTLIVKQPIQCCTLYAVDTHSMTKGQVSPWALSQVECTIFLGTSVKLVLWKHGLVYQAWHHEVSIFVYSCYIIIKREN